jgi:hypothetical protein
MHPVCGGHVCGELICAPCSSSFGSEDGIFCCLEHLNADVNKESQELLERPQLHMEIKIKNQGYVKADKDLGVFIKGSTHSIAGLYSHI